MIISLQELDTILSDLNEAQSVLAESMDVNNLGSMEVLPEFDVNIPALESAVRHLTYMEDDFKKHGVCRDDIDVLLSYPVSDLIRTKLVPAKFTAKKSTIGMDVALESATVIMGGIFVAAVAAFVVAYIALVNFITKMLRKLFGWDKQASSMFDFKFKGPHFEFKFDKDPIPQISVNNKAMASIIILKIADKMPGYYSEVDKQVDWFRGESGKLSDAFQLFTKFGKIGDKLKALLASKKEFSFNSLLNRLGDISVSSIMKTVAGDDSNEMNMKEWKFDITSANRDKLVFNYTEANNGGFLSDVLVKESDIKNLEDICQKLVDELEDLKDTVGMKSLEVDREMRKELTELLGEYKKVGSGIHDLVSCFVRFNGAVVGTKVKLVQHFGKILKAADGHYLTFIKCVDDLVEEMRSSGHQDDLKDILNAVDKFEKSKKTPEDYKTLAEDANVKQSSIFKTICAKRGVTEFILDGIVNGILPVEPELLLIGKK